MLRQLHFGSRARRKARLKRAWVYAWLVTVVAAAAGIPGSPGLGWLDSLAPQPVQAVRIRRVEVPIMRADFGNLHVSRIRPQEPEWTEERITQVIYDAATEFGLYGTYLLSVAECESSLNPLAYNAAGYHGLFQFDQQTWAAYGYGDIYDPIAQARTAASLLARGHHSRWPNCA